MRFPEFTDEWKIANLGDLFTLYSGNTPSRNDKNNFNGDVNWITSGELKNHYIDETNEKISNEALSKSNLKILPVGTLIIATYGLEATGVRSTCSITVQKTTISQACTAFLPRRNVSCEFLYSWYKRHGNVIGIKYAQGTKQQNLSSEIISKLVISYPTTEEQFKLTQFISLIDERIVTQNKIIEKLQSLIKGLINKILFNPQWRKVNLVTFMKFYSTNSLSWELLEKESNKDGMLNIHYGLIHNGNGSKVNITELPKIKPGFIPTQYELCKSGDIVFADASEDTNEIAKAMEFAFTSNREIICGLHTIHGRDIKGWTVTGFKGFVFNSQYFHNQIRRLAQGTKVYSISSKNLNSCFIYLPDCVIQKQIVKLLSLLEEKLQVNKTLLNNFIAQKNYLLSRLFI